MTRNIYGQFQNLNELVGKLWQNYDKRAAVHIGIDLANEIMHILGVPREELKKGDAILDKAYPNAKFRNQKMELWFEKHPYLGNARIALYHYDKGKLPVESKFYQLNESSTKARISATTQLTSNWEDSVLTMIPDYKVGIDYFLSSDGKSLLVVVTNQGNLRVLELTETLSNTQIEIFEKIKNCFLYDGIDAKTGENIPFEPQRTIHRTLWNALELQEVNKKFYNGVADHFIGLFNFLKSNAPIGVSKENIDSESKLFSSRLLGRLLFLWFLRKKEIISKSQGYFSTEGETSSEYYERKLKLLFFGILNKPISERDSDDTITPYLNGGLFEPHKNDWADKKVTFPKDWFDSLFDHFGKFNFTTDESSPEYEQIAIDPEMLGRVFENLLASIVPETSKAANERNNKGAFYTPREIVSYMNKEALKSYLKTNIQNPKDDQGIDRIIDMNDADFVEQKSSGKLEIWGNRTDEVRVKLIDALNDLKILDPACGSGAYPIGLMQLLVRTYDRLSAIYDDSIKKHRPLKLNEANDVYKTKLFIIKSNLYGIDIEPMAIEIARLRSWLSLIIDDKGSIEPLPNLDFNFVCANSLIPLDEKAYQISIFDNLEHEEKLRKLRDTYFDTHEPLEKIDLRNEFAKTYNMELREDEGYKRIQQLKSWNPFESDKPASFFDSKTMFNIDGFDLVIGNPPYIHFEDIREASLNIYKPLNYKTYEARGDIYTLFYEMGLMNLKEYGHLCYITSNKWMRAGYGQSLRDYLVKESNPKLLIDLGSGVFESATVDTNILLLQKTDYENKTTAVVYNADARRYRMEDYLQKNFVVLLLEVGQPWIILSSIEQSIKEKIKRNGIPLKDWRGIRINRGILTGLNEAFILDETKRNEIIRNCVDEEEKTKTEAMIRPILRGKDIKKNSYDWAHKYVIFAYNGISKALIQEYPSVYSHLSKFRQKLEKRGQCRYLSNGKTNNPNNDHYPGYPGMHHWLELDNNPKKDQLEEFLKPKIVYSEIVSSPQFCLDLQGYVPEATAFYMFGDQLEYLTYILNSDITSWIFKKYYAGGGLGDSGYRYKKTYIENLIIPLIPKNEFNYDDLNVAELYGLNDDEVKYILNSLDE
jgi:hypothetical protein